MTLLLWFVLAAFLSYCSHELGHIIACKALGVKIKQVGLRCTGPYIRREVPTPVRNAIVCMAGPAANLLLVIRFWEAWHMLALFNLVMFAVNVLPVTGSDGSHIWDSIEKVKA